MATITGTPLDDNLVGIEGQPDTLDGLAGNDTLTGDLAGIPQVGSGASGGAADGPSSRAATSADGRYVVFESSATNLVDGDTNGTVDIFLKDVQTGTLTRVNTTADGFQTLGALSGSAAISADGRYVAFHSAAGNLLPGDTNIAYDIFLKDTLTGAVTRVSTVAGVQGAGNCLNPAVSADGRYVAFETDAPNLAAGDSNGMRDILLKDTVTGSLTRVNTSAAGAQATGGASQNAALSADGRYVVFESAATGLVAGDTNGVADIFVKDTATGAISRVNTSAAGGQATGGASGNAAVSATGRFVAFESTASNLVAGDNNGQSDIFLKDTQTGAITRVSTDATGAQATGGGSVDASVSADGRYVVFQSTATNLVAGDANGLADIFVKDIQTGQVARVSAAGPSFAPALSADGRYVVFHTDADNLAPGDTNGQTDVIRVPNPLGPSDVLRGGLGDDTYVIFVPNDAVVEAANEGMDTVRAAATYTLPDNVENLVLTGGGNLDGTGNALNNGLTGNTGVNTLSGGMGNDILSGGGSPDPQGPGDVLAGGLGDDTYMVTDGNEQVVEVANEGTDTVQSQVSHTLAANVENLVLTGTGAINGTGNAGNNSLTGNDAANVLNGGAGVDIMAGGRGNDTYVVVNAGDTVNELPGGGIDTIMSSVSLVLPDNVENLILTVKERTGTGNALNNTLMGTADKDFLDGGAGVDTVSYANAAAGVTVAIGLATVKIKTGGAGEDTLSNFENITGSAFNDTLTGHAGNNVIEGGAGDDVMDGGAGADIASYATAGAGVTVNLGLAAPQATGGAGTDTLANFEHLLGSRFNDNLIGDAGDNVLKGGGGKDLLTGGAGADAFVLNSTRGPDTITDFLSGTDKLRFNMAGLGVGDGDTLVENAVVASRGGFDASAELVIIINQIANSIGPVRVAQAIGSATTAYAAGQKCLFAVNNGADTGVFLFTSAGADAVVSATELTLLGTLSGTSTTSLADYVFVA